MRKLLFPLIILASCLTAALPEKPARAQEDQSLQLYEQKIKAGLLYNFLKYTEWPAPKMADPSSPVTVCIFGHDDPFSGYLDPIESRTVNQRSIVIRYVNSVANAAACHLLFISSEEKGRWPELHSFLADKSVLTVGDFAGFLDGGGMIQFSNRQNRVRVELNVEALAKARLRVFDSLRKIVITRSPSPQAR